jgi:hypothetical protein
MGRRFDTRIKPNVHNLSSLPDPQAQVRRDPVTPGVMAQRVTVLGGDHDPLAEDDFRRGFEAGDDPATWVSSQQPQYHA